MNCEIAQERIVLAAYGELAEEQTHELERHMAACPECAGAREQLLALKVLAGRCTRCWSRTQTWLRAPD